MQTVRTGAKSKSATAPPQAVPQREHLVLTRQAAIQSIEAVIGFYRQKEPSSPIPLLLGQARAFATEDFIGALRSVLPKGSFAVDD